MALNEKQTRFVQEYIVDLNATAAAKRAGYSEKTAYSSGQRLLKDVEIQSAIQEAKLDLRRRTELRQEDVIGEIRRLAFFDMRKLVDKNGKPLDVSELDDDTAAALVGLDVQDVTDEDSGGFLGYVKKYKMADKLRALELLCKYLGLFDKRVTVELGENAAKAVSAAAEREAVLERMQEVLGSDGAEPGEA